MENGADKKEITAKKLAEGQVLTQISGNGADVLQMLAMLQRSVAIILMENGASPETARFQPWTTPPAWCGWCTTKKTTT